MKKLKFLGTTATFKSGAVFRVSTIDKRKNLRFWLVTADYNRDESEWCVVIYSVSYFGKFEEVQVLNPVHREYLNERHSSLYVARVVFKHYISTLVDPGSDELPF